MNLEDLEKEYQQSLAANPFEENYQREHSALESAGRVVGAIAGSLALMPVSGIAGLIAGLPRISSDPEKPLFEGPSLERAGKAMEDVGSVPQGLITTPEEEKAIGKVGLLMKPFEMAGKGWGLIGEQANKGIEKLTGKKIPGLEPALATIGEASAVFGAGGLGLKKLTGKTARGLSAKNLEKLGAARESKYGRIGVVPEKVTAGIKTKLPPPLGIESKYLKDKFEQRFLEEQAKPSELQGGKRVAPVQDTGIFKEGMNIPEQGRNVSAVELEDGTIYYDSKAKIHADMLENNPNIPVDRIVDGGFIVNGKYVRGAADAARIGRQAKAKKAVAERLQKDRPVPPEVLKDYPELKATPKGITPKGTTVYGGLPFPAITKTLEKVGTKVWDDAIMKGIPKILDKVPGGKSVNRALIYDYRGDLPATPEYMRLMGESRRTRQLGKSYGIDLGKRLQTVSESDQLKLGEYIRGELKDLSPELKPLGDEAKTAMLTLGKQAVDIGLLSEETFFKNAGRYMPRLYSSKEYQSLLTKFGLKKAERLDLSRFKQRKDIPKEIRQEMGEIMTPGYPIAKGIVQLTHDIETAKWFKGISQNPEWALPKGSRGAVPEGWKQLSSNKKLGALSEAYVHPEIFTDLQQTIRVMETPEKVWRRSLGYWKFGKVILSPKTHSRNLMSNSILAHLGGMPMYEQPIYLTKAARAMRTKDAYWKQSMEEGLLGTTWAEHELSSLFSEAESQIKGIKAESIPEKLGRIGVVWEKSKDLANKAAKTYQAEEEWFKLAKFIHNIERKKMSPKLASADAEKWLFNYGKVTKFQEGYRSKWYGAPFATFTFKALPRIAEAAVKTPHRFLLPFAMVYGLEQAAMSYFGDTSEQAKAKKEIRPEYMKGSPLGIPNFARVPVSDEYGREHYLNLTYILPWGDIGESGSFAGIPGALQPLSQPFPKELWQQAANRDTFFDRQIVPDEELAGKSTWDQIKTQAKLRGKHLGQTLAPTPVLDVIKGVQSLQGKPDYRGRIRKPVVVTADALLGVKMYPVDYAEQMTRIISKKDPQKGYIARKIYGQIRVLAIKKDAAKKAGKPIKEYDEQIKVKTNQLIGLGKELKLVAETYKKTK